MKPNHPGYASNNNQRHTAMSKAEGSKDNAVITIVCKNYLNPAI